MNIILFDTAARKKLFPLTVTKAVADLRTGILTIKERWEKMLGKTVFVLTDSYLQPLYEMTPTGEFLFIDACVIPNSGLIERIMSLGDREAIKDENGFIAGKAFTEVLPSSNDIFSLFSTSTLISSAKRLSFPFELCQWNQEMLHFDFRLITKGRISIDTNDTVHVLKPAHIFIEEGAEVNFSILNASTGPIYIGKNSTIMEGSLIRGPFALGEGGVVKMGAKIYGATTIGPYSSAGGEIKNSIITGYSNKAHDGYLGDSVIGDWCNLGAGTSNSNVKNTGGTVTMWNYNSKEFLPVANKCGVIMGDYSRTAINSSINTGSVIGVSCNVFGAGLLPKLVPDFTWGSTSDSRYEFEKAIKDISNWKNMKNKTLNDQERQVLKHIFELCGKKDLY